MATHRDDDEAVYHRPLLSKLACIEPNAKINTNVSPRVRATLLLILFLMDIITNIIVMYCFKHFNYQQWFDLSLIIIMFSLLFQFLYCHWKCNSMVHIFLQYRYLGFYNLNAYMHVMQHSYQYRFNTKYLPVPTNTTTTATTTTTNTNTTSHTNINNTNNNNNTNNAITMESMNINTNHDRRVISNVDNENLTKDQTIKNENNQMNITSPANDMNSDNTESSDDKDEDFPIEMQMNSCQERCKIFSIVLLKSIVYLCHFGIIEQYIINITQYQYGLISSFLDLCHLHCYFHSFLMFLLQMGFLFNHMVFSDDLLNKSGNNTEYALLMLLVCASVIISLCNIMYTSVTHETYRYLPNYYEKKSVAKCNQVSMKHFYQWVYLFTSDILLRIMPYLLWSVYLYTVAKSDNIWKNSIFITGFVFGLISNGGNIMCHIYIWYYHHYLPRVPWNYTMKRYIYAHVLHPLLVILDIEPFLSWFLRNILFYFSVFGISNISLMAYVWNKPVLADMRHEAYVWKWLLRVECLTRYILGFFLLMAVVIACSVQNNDNWTIYNQRLQTFAIVWMIIHLLLGIFTIWVGVQVSDTPIFRFRWTWLQVAQRRYWTLDPQGIWTIDQALADKEINRYKKKVKLDNTNQGIEIGDRFYVNSEGRAGDEDRNEDGSQLMARKKQEPPQHLTVEIPAKNYDMNRKKEEPSVSNTNTVLAESKSRAYVDAHGRRRDMLLEEQEMENVHIIEHANSRAKLAAVSSNTLALPMQQKEQDKDNPEMTRSEGYVGAGRTILSHSKGESIEDIYTPRLMSMTSGGVLRMDTDTNNDDEDEQNGDAYFAQRPEPLTPKDISLNRDQQIGHRATSQETSIMVSRIGPLISYNSGNLDIVDKEEEVELTLSPNPNPISLSGPVPTSFMFIPTEKPSSNSDPKDRAKAISQSPLSVTDFAISQSKDRIENIVENTEKGSKTINNTNIHMNRHLNDRDIMSSPSTQIKLSSHEKFLSQTESSLDHLQSKTSEMSENDIIKTQKTNKDTSIKKNQPSTKSLTHLNISRVNRKPNHNKSRSVQITRHNRKGSDISKSVGLTPTLPPMQKASSLVDIKEISTKDDKNRPTLKKSTTPPPPSAVKKITLSPIPQKQEKDYSGIETDAFQLDAIGNEKSDNKIINTTDGLSTRSEINHTSKRTTSINDLLLTGSRKTQRDILPEFVREFSPDTLLRCTTPSAQLGNTENEISVTEPFHE